MDIILSSRNRNNHFPFHRKRKPWWTPIKVVARASITPIIIHSFPWEMLLREDLHKLHLHIRSRPLTHSHCVHCSLILVVQKECFIHPRSIDFALPSTTIETIEPILSIFDLVFLSSFFRCSTFVLFDFDASSQYFSFCFFFGVPSSHSKWLIDWVIVIVFTVLFPCVYHYLFIDLIGYDRCIDCRLAIYEHTHRHTHPKCQLQRKEKREYFFNKLFFIQNSVHLCFL